MSASHLTCEIGPRSSVTPAPSDFLAFDKFVKLRTIHLRWSWGPTLGMEGLVLEPLLRSWQRVTSSRSLVLAFKMVPYEWGCRLDLPILGAFFQSVGGVIERHCSGASTAARLP